MIEKLETDLGPRTRIIVINKANCRYDGKQREMSIFTRTARLLSDRRLLERSRAASRAVLHISRSKIQENDGGRDGRMTSLK